MSKMSPAQVRALFPATQRASYLNAAGASPIPVSVEKAITDYYREAAAWGDTGVDTWVRRREEVRRDFVRLIGAAPSEVAFVSNTSTAMHIAGGVLRQRGIKEVVTLEGEFPSTTVPLLQQGLTLRLVRRRPDGTYSLQDIEAAMGRRTGALVVSAVQYASGFRLNLSAASKLCRARGLLFVVNAAQALGQVPIDVEAHGIDLMCGTAIKWMMGGHGLGYFYGRGAVLEEQPLPMGGWLSVERPLVMDNVPGAKVRTSKRRPYVTARGAKLRRDAAALEVGTPAFGLIFGFGEALKIHAQVGVRNTERHNRGLQKVLRQRLREKGFVPNLIDDPEQVAGIAVVPVKGDARTAVRELGKKGVVLTPRGGGIRVSTHIYNAEEDIEQLFWALEKVGVKPAERAG